MLDQLLEFAGGIAEHLVDVDGVVAVVLGGSLARGEASANSDVDLGLYYDPASPPDMDALRSLARGFDDEGSDASVTAPGGWGPWVDGGAWLRIGGLRVDWIYRDLERVRHFAAEALAGRSELHHQPGHPHGFHTHFYAAEVHHCRVLRDPGGALAPLKASLAAYPEELARSLAESFLWQAGFALEVAQKSAARGDTYHVAGCLFECVSDLIQVLYAINGQYFLNQKGSLGATERFALKPQGFARLAGAILACPGWSPAVLGANLERLAALVDETRQLATLRFAEASAPPLAMGGGVKVP